MKPDFNCSLPSHVECEVTLFVNVVHLHTKQLQAICIRAQFQSCIREDGNVMGAWEAPIGGPSDRDAKLVPVALPE